MRKTVAIMIEREYGAGRAAGQLGHANEAVTTGFFLEKEKATLDSAALLERLAPRAQVVSAYGGSGVLWRRAPCPVDSVIHRVRTPHGTGRRRGRPTAVGARRSSSVVVTATVKAVGLW